MKKMFVLLLALLLCLPAAFVLTEKAEAAKRETFASGDYEYALLDDGTAEITGYSGKAESLEISSELDGKSVTAIGDRAFFSCSGLTSVTIPDSVTAIGSNPFQYCESLSDIRVSPDHPALATIDGVLFSKADKRLVCYPCAFSASSYEIPQDTLVIGNHAFFGCFSLTTITIPDSVTAIGDYAFSACKSLTSVTIPNGVTSIGECAFSICSSLTSVAIPDSVTAIGIMAFGGCKSLTSIAIPDSVTVIGQYAFCACSGLTSIVVGRDSYAKQYCVDNDLPYTYADANDLLNG